MQTRQSHARPRRSATFGNRLGSFGVTAALTLVGGGLVAGRCAPPAAPAAAPAPAAAAPAPAPAAAPAPDLSTFGQQVANLANQARTNAGLAPLTVDARLVSGATAHSADQAARNTMSHTGSNGSTLADRIAATGFAAWTWAENVAAGQTTPQAVFDAWMNSAGHRSNILNKDLTHVGVGVAAASNGTLYWTMDFAAGS